ncbi:MAG: Rieske 2Fe-2S domain-containing protein [Planctomycetota bacterium]
MRLTTLGHNGLRIDLDASPGGGLLINPWLNPAGALDDGAWQQGPAVVTTDESLADVAAVVITHGRPDHLDPYVLSRLAPTTLVLIPRLASKAWLRDRLPGATTIIELGDWEWHDITPSLRVLLVPEMSPCPHAAVVVRAGDRMLVDLNEAQLGQLPLRVIRQYADKLADVPDVVTVRPVPASLDPLAVSFENDTKRENAFRRARLRGLEFAVQALRVLQPRVVVPLAGSPLGYDELTTDAADIGEQLTQRIIKGVTIMQPGDQLDLGTDPGRAGDGSPRSRGPERVFATADQSPRKQTPWTPVPRSPLDPAGVTAGFTALLAGMPPGTSLGLRMGLEATGANGPTQRWIIDFRPATQGVTPTADSIADCDYQLRVAASHLAGIVAGRITWDDLVGLLQLHVERGPRFRKDQPLLLLRHAGHDPAGAGQRVRDALAATRTIRLRDAAGQPLEFERHCPHSGLDLSETGELLDDGRVLRCVAHHYEFSLRDGACLNAQCRPLRVGPEAPAP